MALKHTTGQSESDQNLTEPNKSLLTESLMNPIRMIQTEELADEETDDQLTRTESTSKEESSITSVAKKKSVEDKRPRKFICRYCHKAFSLMNVLKVHERIHTGEKPYVCEICDKAFNQSGSLNRHKNTHVKRSCDSRSYSCRYCQRQFLHSSQLQEHEATDHDSSHKKPNPCTNTLLDGRNCRIKQPADASIHRGAPKLLKHNENTSNFEQQPSPLNDLFGKLDCTTQPPSLFPLPVGLDFLHSNLRHFAPNELIPNSHEEFGSKLHDSLNHFLTNNQERKELYSCELCTAEFQTRADLNRHMGQHLLQQISSTSCNPKHTAPHQSFDVTAPSPMCSDTNTTSTPLETLLFKFIQEQGSQTIPFFPLNGTTNCNVRNTSTDSDSPLTALFPNPATAAALTALGQLLFTNQNRESLPSGISNVALAEETIETNTSPTPDSPFIGTNFTSNKKSIDQILNSIVSFNPSMQRTDVVNLFQNGDKDQCLDLAVPRQSTQPDSKIRLDAPKPVANKRIKIDYTADASTIPDSSIAADESYDERENESYSNISNLLTQKVEKVDRITCSNEAKSVEYGELVINSEASRLSEKYDRSEYVPESDNYPGEQIFVCKNCGNIQTQNMIPVPADSLIQDVGKEEAALDIQVDVPSSLMKRKNEPDSATTGTEELSYRTSFDCDSRNRDCQRSPNIQECALVADYCPPSTKRSGSDDLIEKNEFNAEKFKELIGKMPSKQNIAHLLSYLQEIGCLYECEYCEQHFIDQDAQKLHMLWFHSGLSPFSCAVCGIHHSSSVDVLRHLNDVHAPTKHTATPTSSIDELNESDDGKRLCIVDDEMTSSSCSSTSKRRSEVIEEVEMNDIKLRPESPTCTELSEKPSNKRPCLENNIKHKIDRCEKFGKIFRESVILNQPRCMMTQGSSNGSAVENMNGVLTGMKIIDNVN